MGDLNNKQNKRPDDASPGLSRVYSPAPANQLPAAFAACALSCKTSMAFFN
jgi:hypothetical protein